MPHFDRDEFMTGLTTTRGLLIAAGIMILSSPGIAAAQSAPPRGMPTRDLMNLVVEQGYEPISRPIRRGRQAMIVAVDEASGIEMRLLVDTWTGDVLAARPRDDGPGASFDSAGIDGPLTPPRVIRALPDGARVAAPTPKPRPTEIAGLAASRMPAAKPLQPIAAGPQDAPTRASAMAADARDGSQGAPTVTGAIPAVQPLE